MTMTFDAGQRFDADTLPPFISVDDHVLEPPDLWTARLPRRYADVGPRVVREKGVLAGALRLNSNPWRADDNGNWCDVWRFEDVVWPLLAVFACAGLDKRKLDLDVATYESVRPGCWQQAERLADMTLNGAEVSVCFPNTIPRFCGQTFLEARDKELALLCVQAYNDWLVDEWCAGAGRGRLIPVAIVPLWDVDLAVAEVHRAASRGIHAITFSEQPHALGLPSMYTGHWDPLFAACADTGTTVCIHIGSSSQVPETAKDAPRAARSTLTFEFAMHSLIDMLLCGVLERIRGLKVVYSEGNVGWMPYVLERLDKVWRNREIDSKFVGTRLGNPPSTYVAGSVYGCVVDDVAGIRGRGSLGGQLCFETDYPHGDSMFPDSRAVAAHLCNAGGLTDEEAYRFLRGNAIDAFGLQRFGISE